MNIPEHFTPMQKMIISAYIQVRNTPEASMMTFHTRESSFVRDVIHQYKIWLQKEDAKAMRLKTGG